MPSFTVRVCVGGRMSSDISWTGGICPICLFAALTSPRAEDSLAVACERCGNFDLSDAAEDVLDTYAGRLDRARLSEVLCDVCVVAECERPLIDSITAHALIGFATA